MDCFSYLCRSVTSYLPLSMGFILYGNAAKPDSSVDTVRDYTLVLLDKISLRFTK